MKKTLSLLLVVLMLISLAACATSQPVPTAGTSNTQPATTADTSDTQPATTVEKSKPVIAFVPKTEGNAWWSYVRTGVEDWAKETGYDVIYKGPISNDPAEQVQIMSDLVAQDIDILCFSALDTGACEAVCKEARDKGIIVIATECSGMTNIDYDVEAFSEEGFGGFLMDTLAEMMGEEGEYVTMVNSLTQESLNNWADAAVKRQLEAYPNMTLIPEARVISNGDTEIAYEVTKELIKKNPNLKGILGTGSYDAPGAARAIDELGLVGKVFAVSIGMPSETRDFLKEGTLESVALWDPAIAAKAMLNLSIKMWNGESVTNGMNLDVAGYENIVLDGTTVTGDGWIKITKDNVDDFTF